jgi:hypothetical protein
MEQNNVTINSSDALESPSKAVSSQVSEVSNAVLKRLIEEVKYESQNNISAYNRTHNRHNRGR